MVAVHGLNGDPINTWTRKGSVLRSSTMWLKDLLPEKLPGARIMTFGYDATLVGNTSTGGVQSNAGVLLADLKYAREGYVSAMPREKHW